jgi:hypothetical protein
VRPLLRFRGDFDESDLFVFGRMRAGCNMEIKEGASTGKLRWQRGCGMKWGKTLGYVFICNVYLMLRE